MFRHGHIIRYLHTPCPPASAAYIFGKIKQALARGARLVASLNQPAFQPWPVEEQVAIIFAASRGYLDAADPSDIPRVNEEIRSALRDEGTILTEIRETQDLPDALQDKLGKFLEALMKRLVGVPGGNEAAA